MRSVPHRGRGCACISNDRCGRGPALPRGIHVDASFPSGGAPGAWPCDRSCLQRSNCAGPFADAHAGTRCGAGGDRRGLSAPVGGGARPRHRRSGVCPPGQQLRHPAQRGFAPVLPAAGRRPSGHPRHRAGQRAARRARAERDQRLPCQCAGARLGAGAGALLGADACAGRGALRHRPLQRAAAGKCADRSPAERALSGRPAVRVPDRHVAGL